MPASRFRWYNAIGLMAGLVFALFPIFWMLSTSFKPLAEWITVPPTWLPKEPTLANYAPLFRTFDDRYITGLGAGWRSMLDSIICSGSATLISVAFGLAAALGYSRYRAGGDHFALAVLSVRIVPTVMLAIPMLFLFGELGLRDTYIGVILANVALTVPFSFWMLKSFIDEVPQAIEEASMMDGFSRWQAHFFVTVPLIRGGLMATGLFVFILNWSEFLITMTLTDKNVITLPVSLHHYEGMIGVQAAFAAFAAAPILVLGFLIEKHLARAFTLGAIKR
ncbi:MAG: carbohydrate ABC transporter permease [Alphaproteobacteria bacterium]|nr:carbohydrate ABC transporter permease [Alphaproteobacteria bacterium]